MTLNDYPFPIRWKHSRRSVRNPQRAAVVKEELTKRGMFVNIIESVLEVFDDTIRAYRAVLKFLKRFNHISFYLIRTETMKIFAPTVL